MPNKVKKITIIEEGRTVSNEIIHFFNLRGEDIRNNTSLGNVCNFTGLTIKNDKMLFSMPKNYMDISYIRSSDLETKLKYIKLVLRSIIEYETNSEYKSFRRNDDFKSSFSLSAFYNIVNYYKKYGLFYQNSSYIGKGYTGKVHWKRTIQNSNKIIDNDGNLVFVPFFINIKSRNSNFITECMVFAINYTRELLSGLIDIPNTTSLNRFGINRNMINNEYVIYRLKLARQKTFKDSDKELLSNLILFFEGVNLKNVTSISIKHYYYSGVWEKAVEKYLNKHFLRIKDSTALFQNRGGLNKFKKISLLGYDTEHKNNNLEPDHYYYDSSKNTQYIFDSKYYTKVKSLNHKQLVYHMLLANRAKRTYDALIMPTAGETNTTIHVNIAPDYLFSVDNPIKVLLIHLNMITVLNNFVE